MPNDTRPGYANPWGVPYEPDPMQPPLRSPKLPNVGQERSYPDPRLPIPPTQPMDQPPVYERGRPGTGRYEQIPVINPPFV